MNPKKPLKVFNHDLPPIKINAQKILAIGVKAEKEGFNTLIKNYCSPIYLKHIITT